MKRLRLKKIRISNLNKINGGSDTIVVNDIVEEIPISDYCTNTDDGEDEVTVINENYKG